MFTYSSEWIRVSLTSFWGSPLFFDRAHFIPLITHTYFSLQCSHSLHSWALPKRGIFVDPFCERPGERVFFLLICISFWNKEGGTPFSAGGKPDWTGSKRARRPCCWGKKPCCWWVNSRAGDGLSKKRETGRKKKKPKLRGTVWAGFLERKVSERGGREETSRSELHSSCFS